MRYPQIRNVFRKASRRTPADRRGVASLLAMMFMVLFGTLAVGFYAAFTLTTQTTYNERDARRALSAAESGMEFARYQLWLLDIDYADSAEDLFNKVEAGLAANINGTPNLAGGGIARTNGVLRIPASANNYIPIDSSGDAFRLEITNDGTELIVTAVGRSAGGSIATSSPQRAIRMRYGVLERPSSIFNFGVASRSAVHLDSNARITGFPNPAYGSVLSTSMSGTPVVLSGNAQISGDVSLVNPDGSVSMSSSASIAGSSNPEVIAEHIHVGVSEPEFPTIDTDIFKPFATNVLSAPGAEYSGGTMKNLYIKANTNPTFGSNTLIQGVIYIETPNKVTFNSNVDITGAIVVQNEPTGTPSTNVISFNSNVKLQGVDMLPATSDFPPELRALSGSMILAPTFTLVFNSNFGTFAGSVVGSQVEFDSFATGTIKGSVINLDDTSMHFDSNARISIENPGTSYAPAGMYFGSRYVPLPASYEEVQSW